MKFYFDQLSHEMKPVAEKLLDRAADNIGEWTFDHTLGALVTWISDKIMNLVHLVNYWSPEIITIGVIACAAGMMFGPLIQRENKWFGRLVAVLIIGSIWRMLIL